MILNKEYKSKSGAIRTPLNYSDCGRYLYTKCIYKDGKILFKWFYKLHRVFNI
jgi:hypothetical protein